MRAVIIWTKRAYAITKKGVGVLIPIGSGTEKAETIALHYITMSAQVYNDLCAYVDHYETEVSGCGLVERVEHRTKSDVADEPDKVEIEFRISEVYLPSEQENSASSTDIDDDIIAKLMMDLLAKGKNTEHLRLHWHSHADMDTFHSGTDEDNYATLSSGEFLVSLVLNKAHKFLGRVDYFTPLRVCISGMAVYMIIDNKIEASKDAVDSIVALDAFIKKEKEEKDKKYLTYQPPGRDSMGYQGNMYDTGYADKKKKGKPHFEKLTDDEKDIAKCLQISIKDAMEFKGCSKMDCHCCDKVVECNEFLYQTDNYDLNC